MTMQIIDLGFCEASDLSNVTGGAFQGKRLETDVKAGLKTKIDLNVNVSAKNRSGSYDVAVAAAGGGVGAASFDGEARVYLDLGIATNGAAAKRFP
jgi:hypothetical protein